MEIWLSTVPGAALSAEWTWAFVVAAADWTAKTEFNIHLDGQNPDGKTIFLAKLPITDPNTPPDRWCRWADTVPTQLNYMLGPYPIGRPGSIVLNASFNVNPPVSCGSNPYCGSTITTGDPIERLTFDQKVKIAAHEIGHALGLVHPLDVNSEHLAGTALATAANAMNYPSVMWNGCAGGNNTKDLSSDDVVAANIIALVP